jgi:hypothetical protein
MYDKNKRLKIAYLSPEDPHSKRSWSGITYYMAQALQMHCGDVYYLGPISSIEQRLAYQLSRSIHSLFKKHIQGVRQLVFAAHVKWDDRSPSPRTLEDVHRASVRVAR